MGTNISKIYCKTCGKEKDSSFCNFCKKETKNHFEVLISEQLNMIESLQGEHERPGLKRFLVKFFKGYQKSINTEKCPEGVERQMNIDRENNWYDEVVKDGKTGQIIKECHEKLSEHIGHGDAKK